MILTFLYGWSVSGRMWRYHVLLYTDRGYVTEHSLN